MKKIVSSFLMVAFSVLSITAQNKCYISANIIDSDPSGTNIRSGAGKNFSILKTIPNIRVLVSIKGSKNSWMKISEVQDTSETAENTEIWKGSGWMFASMLGFTVKPTNNDGTANLYAQPDKNSRVLRKIARIEPVTLADCLGSWAKVQYKGQTGWLESDAQCAEIGGLGDSDC